MRKYLIVFAFMAATPALAQDAGQLFAGVDADKDGKVSYSEAQMKTMVSRGFKDADRNQDGYLSRTEFLAAFKKMRE